LIERKQLRARQRIIAAAAELFADHGFDAVSVSDIAERAEVGRTTFFRYFGDKQEVVFAREQEVLDLIAGEHLEIPRSGDRTPTSALRALEPVLLRVCDRMTSSPDGYRAHMQLVDGHGELRGRDAAKMRVAAERLSGLLLAGGWDAGPAALAAELALACYWTARSTNPDPEDLSSATRNALRHTLELGKSR
jgi:AcrR family transcriptional regulator